MHENPVYRPRAFCMPYNRRMTALLIADDSEAKIMLLKAVLRHAKWPGEVLVAHTTEEAEALIGAHDIRFAFIDYYIPSKNGPAIIRTLKAKTPDARIVLVSSSDQQENIAEARAAGADGFVCTSWEGERAEKAILGILEEWMA